MGIVLVLRDRDARQVDLVVAVAVPVFPRDGVGIMRVRHGDDHAERPFVAPSGDIVQLLARGEGDFLVEVDLVGPHT
jgi:hypothetical protein